MKRSAFLIALCLAAAVSLAFYQRTEGPAVRHLLLIARYEHTSTSGGLLVPTLNLVGAEGAPRVQKMALRGTVHAQLNALHQAEAAKLDSLSGEGWTVGSTWSSQTLGGVVETTHALTQSH